MTVESPTATTHRVPTDVNLPKVEIHATDVCNNRCGFCSTGLLNHEKSEQLKHPPRELIRRQLEEGYQRGARRVLFQGGEPTVRRDLGDLLADAHDIGYQVTTIFTNARMAASRAGARWMAGMKVTWFQVSIQGGTAEAHDASVRAPGAWAQTVAGTRRLIELGQRVKVNGVLTKHLLDTLPQFADLLCELRPEEIGMDTVKPSDAFTLGFEDYAAIVPPYSRYAGALRDALVKMNEAGVVARLTAFPPCLVPGAEQFVAEENPATLSQDHRGRIFNKLQFKRDMMVKSDACRGCAYDDTCGGVYEPYARANGLGELHAISARKAAPEATHAPAADAPLTRALRALFVREGQPGVGVREVRRIADGSHELRCAAHGGDFTVLVEPRNDRPAYAKTARFAVSYRTGAGERPIDHRILDAIVRTLQRAETYLAGVARSSTSAPSGTSPADPTAR